MQTHSFSFEVIVIDDGSSDNTWSILRELSASNKSIKGLKFRRNYGKSAALNRGFEKAQGDVVITMDADLQDSPDEIPELHRLITEDGFDMVSGWKQNDTIYPKTILPNFIIGQLVKHREFIYTILIVDEGL